MKTTTSKFFVALLAVALFTTTCGLASKFAHSSPVDRSSVSSSLDSVAITKVARVAGNFLEWDLNNTGTADVWVAPYATFYMPIGTAPFYAKIIFTGSMYFEDRLVGILSDRGSTVAYEGYGWVRIPAGESARIYSQGVVPLYAKWALYNVLVYEGTIRPLSSSDVVTNISTDYSDSRVPSAIGTNFLWSAINLDPGHMNITRRAAASVICILYACNPCSPYTNGGQLCSHPVNFHIDSAPAGGRWIVNDVDPATGHCRWLISGGTPSVTLVLSETDTSALAPGLHVLTVDFPGDVAYAPSSCKLLFTAA